MINPIDLCRELQEALDGNSTVNKYTGEFQTCVDPTFFARLKAVVTHEPQPVDLRMEDVKEPERDAGVTIRVRQQANGEIAIGLRHHGGYATAEEGKYLDALREALLRETIPAVCAKVTGRIPRVTRGESGN